MSCIHIAPVALVASALAASALTLAPDRGESTPRGDSDVAAEPEPETVRPCRTAVFGEPRPGWRKRAVVAGPLALTPLKPYFKRGPKFFQPDAELKVLALVDAGASVTLAVPEAERRRLSLLYDFGPGPRRDLRFSDGTSSVRFSACSRSGAEYPGPGGYPGRETQFNGGLFVRGAHCVAIEVWTEGRTDPRHRWLPFGVGDRQCPPARA